MSNINQYPNESLTFNDDDFYDIDFYNGSTFETKKILGSTIKAGILAGIVFENLYTQDGVLATDRIVAGNNHNLRFRAVEYFEFIGGSITNPIPTGLAIFNIIGQSEEGDYLFKAQNAVTGTDIIRGYHNGEIEINEAFKLPTVDGVAGQHLTTDGAGNVTWQQGNIGNYAQTVVSATINTTGEQSIIGSGVGSLTIPANAFTVGNSFHAKLGGVINSTGGGGNSEIRINIKAGTTILATTNVFDLDNATNEGWECELDFTIAKLGGAGTAEICTNGNFAYTKTNDKKVSGYVFQDVNNTTFDTTISNTLEITAEWVTLNGGDDIYSANFVLYKTF